MNKLTQLIRSNQILSMVVVAFLFGYSIFLYLPSIQFDFVYFDDDRLVLRQGVFYDCGGFSDCVKAFINYIPTAEEPLIFRNVTWLVDAKIFGHENPFGYHLGNVVYHALVIVFAFIFLYRFTKKIIPSFLAVFLYASLAIHTESVGWIMGRKDILSALFLFLLLNVELYYFKAKKLRNKSTYYSLTLLLISLACLSKISAITFCIILFLFKILLNIQENKILLKKSLLETLPHIFVSVLIYQWYSGVLEVSGVLKISTQFSLMEKLYILFVIDPLVLIKYIFLVLSPHKLSVSYQWLGIEEKLSVYDYGLSFLVIITCLLILCHLVIKKKYRISFFFLSLFFLLIPYSNMVNYGWWYANRYFYVASFFLISSAVIFLSDFTFSRIAKIAMSFLYISLIVINVVQIKAHLPVWKDSDSLCNHHLSISRFKKGTVKWCMKIIENHSYDLPKEQKNKMLSKWLSLGIKALEFENDDEYSVTKTDFILNYRVGRYLYLLKAPLDQQIHYFQRSFELNPKFPDASFALAQSYFGLVSINSDSLVANKFAEISGQYFMRYFENVVWNPSAEAQFEPIYLAFSDHPEIQSNLLKIKNVKTQKVKNGFH